LNHTEAFSARPLYFLYNHSKLSAPLNVLIDSEITRIEQNLPASGSSTLSFLEAVTVSMR